MDEKKLTISGDFYASAALYAAKYRDQTVVIKFGGELVANERVMRNLMVQAITLKNFGARVVLIHGGGVQIDEELVKANIAPKKIDGVRDTDIATLEITHRCLNDLNRRVVNYFHEEAARLKADVAAIGLGGNDDRLIVAREKFPGSRTGEVDFLNIAKFNRLVEQNTVPILHPICAGDDGLCMNVNADEVAAAIAIGLKAKRLILCSNIPGVLDKDKNKIPQIITDGVQALVDDGTVSGGMIPKIVSAAKVADSQGVGGVVILDGADPHAIERELLTDGGAGTLIQSRKDQKPEPAFISQLLG